MKKIFGYITIFNIKKRRKSGTLYDDPCWKIKWIFWWNAPKWLYKHFEGICFDNIYHGTPDDRGEKRTCLIFSGSKNLYWVFFRRVPGHWEGRTGDWKWCLKFMKSTNDHCGMG